MTINANAQGVVDVTFTIPADIRTGTKRVDVIGISSQGTATFTGEGLIETLTKRRITSTQTRFFDPPPPPTSRPIDPLAQTFMLPEKAQISAVDLYFCAKGPTKILVQIRETELGFPTQRIISQASKATSDITINDFNRFEFDWPVTLNADQEYCVVVLCDDAVSSCGVAELGKWDAATGWVTSQPYQIGVLLSSSNAVTWTAHQDRDLTFKLIRNSYTETSRTIDLGLVPVVNMSDFLVAGAIILPDEVTRADFRLTLPDLSQVTVATDQAVKLPIFMTGDVRIEAILTGSERFSPILFPGTQLIWGTQQATGTYITRAMLAGVNSRVRVIFDAYLPSGATVSVDVSGVDELDTWAAIPQLGLAVPMDNGWHEFTYEAPDVDENMVRVRLTLNGTPAARPQVSNFRAMVM